MEKYIDKTLKKLQKEAKTIRHLEWLKKSRKTIKDNLFIYQLLLISFMALVASTIFLMVKQTQSAGLTVIIVGTISLALNILHNIWNMKLEEIWPVELSIHEIGQLSKDKISTISQQAYLAYVHNWFRFNKNAIPYFTVAIEGNKVTKIPFANMYFYSDEYLPNIPAVYAVVEVVTNVVHSVVRTKNLSESTLDNSISRPSGTYKIVILNNPMQDDIEDLIEVAYLFGNNENNF